MNFSDFITHHGKRVNREHYIHLIQVSKIDGKISPEEMEMLHKEGRKFGLTDPEIDNLIMSSTPDDYHAPYSLRDKFEQLYNIAEIVLADNYVSESEKKLIRRFAIEAGFSDKVIDGLLTLLLEGVAEGVDEEKLFKEFKDKYL